ncbi:sigma-70 family RNA polymerase sigma factor [Fischerella sp. JS2]|uniref:sigma-70 family RNA polymerase sigma factor n=1 Tax=Fischerella sp. JS2 TaxID=2597771 RepID=UPI0028F091DA|nr:sigma-70 family RNA polymerase sigma factor [Fischerella sp. JS2]
MKKREDIIEKFSTFLSFGNSSSDVNPIWQTDPDLERCIKSLVESEPDANEEFWAQYFLKVLREESQSQSQEDGEKYFTPPHSSFIAGRHMSAYLQEACLWASQKAYQRFKYLRHKYPLEEYFQIANAAANPPAKLLKNFNVEYPLTNIEGYAKTAIIRLISNTIYRHDIEAKRGKFSDYGLLKDLNAKELREALFFKGINHKKLNSYYLIWQCLDKIYQPTRCQGGRSLEPPNQQHLQEIAHCYNQQINKLDFPTAPVSSEKVQSMLSTCVRAARDYRTKRFLSLEEYDNIFDPTLTPWDNLIQEEAWEQVHSIISNLFASIPETGQIMLKLWQGLGLTQTEIATILKASYPGLQKQYQVARQLSRYLKNILKDLAIELNKIHPDVCLHNEKDIENIKDAMNECIQSHCQKLLYSTLDRIEKQSLEQEKLLTISREIHLLGQQNYQQIAILLSEASSVLSQVKQNLIISFKDELAKSMNLEHNSLEVVNHKIADFIEEWLKSKLYFAKQG